nr:hypothetical protein NG677_04145 [Methylobacterium sp. OTU13CASTA1]
MALIKEKGGKDEDAVPMDFGQAQSALATGKYVEVLPEGAEAGPEIHGGVWGNEPVDAKAEDVKARAEAGHKGK